MNNHSLKYNLINQLTIDQHWQLTSMLNNIHMHFYETFLNLQIRPHSIVHRHNQRLTKEFRLTYSNLSTTKKTKTLHSKYNNRFESIYLSSTHSSALRFLLIENVFDLITRVNRTRTRLYGWVAAYNSTSKISQLFFIFLFPKIFTIWQQIYFSNLNSNQSSHDQILCLLFTNNCLHPQIRLIVSTGVNRGSFSSYFFISNWTNIF